MCEHGLSFRGTTNLNAKYMLEYSSSLSFHERVANLNVSERKHQPLRYIDHGRRGGFPSIIKDFSGGRGTAVGWTSLCNNQNKNV